MSLQYGLYAAFLPLVGYAGCPASHMSRHLAVGPVALVSLLLKSGLTPLLDEHYHHDYHPTNNTLQQQQQQQQQLQNDNDIDPQDYQTKYNQLAIQCSLLLGISYLILGWCRLGCVTVFLSHAVVSGFTTGAAVLIAASQIQHLLGYRITGETLPQLIAAMVVHRNRWNPVTWALGCAAIAALLTIKKIDVQQQHHPQY